MTYQEACKILKDPINWGEGWIERDEYHKRVAEAKELSKGLRLLTSEERTWYEDSYTVYSIDHSELARLIEIIREERN